MAATLPTWQGLLFGLLFLLPGLGLLVAAVRRARKAVAAGRASQTTVADLTPGDLVTVTGEVEPLTDDRVPAHFLSDTGGGVAVVTRVRGRTRTSTGGGGGPGTSGTSRKTWTTERRHFETVPFGVDDGTGTVRIEPPPLEAFPTTESFRDAIRIETRTVGDAPHLVGNAPAEFDEYAFDGEAVADVDADRRFEQGVLQDGGTVTVMGRVHEDETSGELVVGSGDSPDVFTLSTGENDGASVTRQFLWAVLLGGIGGVLAAIGGFALAVSVLPAVL